MAIDVPLLSRICEAPGAPGFEKRIRELVLVELEGLADEVRVDDIGNVVALKKGRSSAKRSIAAAHIVEIGFIVTHVDDKGFIRFNPVGGFDPKTLTPQRVIVHGKKDLLGVMGSKPTHIMQPEERTKAAKITDYFIDTGLPKRRSSNTSRSTPFPPPSGPALRLFQEHPGESKFLAARPHLVLSMDDVRRSTLKTISSPPMGLPPHADLYRDASAVPQT